MTTVPAPGSPEACFGGIPTLTFDAFGVPLVFRRNCALWEGIARRISSEGHCVDTDQVRVRIGTPSEDVAQYHGHFLDAKLVFPLTDEVYTLAGEKATALDT